MIIEKNRVVTLAYQLFSLNEKQETLLLEERTVDDPLEFIFGNETLLPKVEKAIVGKGRGFQIQIDLDPRDAFGLHNPDLVAEMDLQKFPKDPPLELGMKFQTQGPLGDVLSVIVKEIKEDKVLVDGNHPLAGLSLRFDVRILRVREALPEELASQQVKTTLLH